MCVCLGYWALVTVVVVDVEVHLGEVGERGSCVVGDLERGGGYWLGGYYAGRYV